MKVLVTGGSGLVGRWVVDALAGSHDVHVLDVQAPQRKDIPYHRVDVLHAEPVGKAVRGFDAVVHLAGIPHPLDHPADVVFAVNAVGTLNVLEACTAAGVRTFILMSSESTLGFAFSRRRTSPLYLPIDEQHPTSPQDPYGLSKLTAELLCAGYTRRSGLTTFCLRAPWIWVPEEHERKRYRELVRDWEKWWKNLWAFVHVEDVADAIGKLLMRDQGPDHDVFFLSAADNWIGRDSRELAARFFPETTDVRKSLTDSASLISFRKATAAFGFVPKRGVRDVLD